MLHELYAYRDHLIHEMENSYTPKQRSSEFYTKVTLQECISSSMYRSYISLECALNDKDNEKLRSLISVFEEEASSYGASWWDEDLECKQPGYKFETEFYVTLRNIAAKALGLPSRNFSEFYDGRV